MGQVLHGSATTTEAIRRAIQHSQASLRTLAEALRHQPEDRRQVEAPDLGRRCSDWPEGRQIDGPVDRGGGSHRRLPKAYPAAAGRLSLCPAADHPASDAVIPASLPAAPWHLPAAAGRRREPDRSKFKAYPIGYFHIDIAEVRTAQGKLYLFVAIDRTSKFAFVELHEKAARRTAADFLRRLIAAVPYKVHTVLTDNGTHFTTPGNTAQQSPISRPHIERGTLSGPCLRICLRPRDIDHRLTKPKHPWTNGQVERMNRTIKDATVKRYYYETTISCERHLADFVAAYNFARRLKTLKGLTPYEFICNAWTSQPERFTLNPLQQMPGLNI